MHYACSVWMAGAFRCIMLVMIKWLRCSNALYLQCSNCWDVQIHYNCSVWMVETSKSSQRFAKSPRAPEYLCARDIHCTAIIVRHGVLIWNALYRSVWMADASNVSGTHMYWSRHIFANRCDLEDRNRQCKLFHAWVCHDKGHCHCCMIVITIASHCYCHCGVCIAFEMQYVCSVEMAETLKCTISVVFKWLWCWNAVCL